MTTTINKIIESKAILSPLAGVSDLAFRLICRKFGCGFAFTEMVDAKAVLFAKSKKFHLLDTCEQDRPLGVQLVEADENFMLEAALKCQDMGIFSLININAACPVKKLIRKKKGVDLMRNPEKIAKIIRILSSNLELPVVLKIRSGFDNDNRNCAEIARIAQEEGAKAIFLHPRTGSQQYKGHIDFDDIEAVKKNINIPLIISGDLFTPQDAVNMINNPYCDAVAIARGSFGRPWIFKEIDDLFNNRQSQEITLDLKINTVKEHFDILCSYLPMKFAVMRMYKQLVWYFKTQKGIGEYKNFSQYMGNYNDRVKTKEDFYAFVDGIYEG
ncbi:tRNA-dihydrouridine synthase family protein, partial [bacterium]|nr:tRNA-dihydrouridine synthase family protein [bacterium]